MYREELESLLAEGLSLEQIARRVDRDASTVGYWVRKHGLRAVNRDRHASRGGITRERLERLIAEGLTQREMGARLGLSQGTIRHWLTRYGLRTLRRRSPTPDRRPQYLWRRCLRHGWSDFVQSGGRYRCVRCRSEAVARRRRRVKQILVAEAGGRCEICGYDRSFVALHFHHLDPAEKRFSVSYNGATIAIDRLRRETAKCALVCANCHAEVEAGLAKLPPRATSA